MKNRFELIVKDLKTGQQQTVGLLNDTKWINANSKHIDNPALSFVVACIKPHIEEFVI